MTKLLAILAIILICVLSSFSAKAGEAEDKIRASQARLNAEYKALAQARREQSHKLFQKIVTDVVDRNFGGLQDPAIRFDSRSFVDSTIYFGEFINAPEFSTKKGSLCGAWGAASCRKGENQCSLKDIHVQCTNRQLETLKMDLPDRTF